MRALRRSDPRGGRLGTLDRGRRGVGLILVLVFLAVLALLSVAAIKAALIDRERLVRQTRLAQAELLAESGRDRARLRLAADPGYTGETWEVADAGPAGAGRVEIRVEPPVDDSPATAGPTVHVRAEYPTGRTTPRVARSHLTFQAGSVGTAERSSTSESTSASESSNNPGDEP